MNNLKNVNCFHPLANSPEVDFYVFNEAKQLECFNNIVTGYYERDDINSIDDLKMWLCVQNDNAAVWDFLLLRDVLDEDGVLFVCERGQIHVYPLRYGHVSPPTTDDDDDSDDSDDCEDL